MSEIKKQRLSGIELLRIVAACGVILLHYNDGKAFTYIESIGGLNQSILFFAESMCICAVDLFILISGYFMCTSQKRIIGKPLELIVQIITFKEAFYLLRVIVKHESINLKGIASNLIPSNYFVILYITLYLISPYINIVLNKLNKDALKKFILLSMILFSAYPTLVDLSGEILNKEWFGLSSIAAWGNQQGFNIINFILLYCVGAYLRLEKINERFKKKSILISALLALFVLIFVWSEVNQFMSLHGLRSAWVYHNPLVILEAVCLFLIFNQFKIKSKTINALAKASFTCFLFHGYLLDIAQIQWAVNRPCYVLILHIILTVTIIYVISWIVYLIYHYATNWLLKRFDEIKFPTVEL